MERTSSSKIAAAFILLTLVWGTTWAAIRVGLDGIPPLSGVALRFALAGGVLAVLARHLGVRPGWSRREVSLFAANALLSFCVSYSVVYWAEQYLPSGLTAVLFATHPLMVALLAHFVLPGERLSRLAVAGLLLGFAGVGVIFSDDLRQLGGEQVRFAALVLLVAPAASAAAGVAAKRWGHGIHPLSMAAMPMLFSVVVMAPAALAIEHARPLVLDLRSVGALLYLALFGSALTFTVYYWLLARVSATAVSLTSFTIPVVAVAVGVAVFDEPLRARLLLGSALVLAGVVAVSRAHHVRG